MMNEFIPLMAIIGISLLLITLFFTVFKLDQKDWRTKFYPLFIALLGGLGGLWLHFGSKYDPINLPKIYIAIQVICLGMGMTHLWIMYKKLFWSSRDGFDSEKDSFLPELVYTMIVYVFSLLDYWEPRLV